MFLTRERQTSCPHIRVMTLPMTSNLELRSIKSDVCQNFRPSACICRKTYRRVFTHVSTFPASAPIFFARQLDCSLWPCINYGALNSDHMKPPPAGCCSLSVNSDWLRAAHIFTKLDLHRCITWCLCTRETNGRLPLILDMVTMNIWSCRSAHAIVQ